MLTNWEIIKIKKLFYFRTLPDVFQRIKINTYEWFRGIDCAVFSKTIQYYLEKRNQKITCEDALKKALNKEAHKEAWYKKKRESVDDIMNFYKEVDVYIFRQPYLKRRGDFRWYRHLVDHFKNPSILEYGCGSAALTEWLIKKFPECKYTVADIPSSTLDFVSWKKNKYKLNYDILEIGKGAEGIPLKEKYNLIICQDVLEHTPNPLEIIKSFYEHMSENGILLIDFIDSTAGENLLQSNMQRDAVKKFLKSNLHAIKSIDEPRGNAGVYLKVGKV